MRSPFRRTALAVAACACTPAFADHAPAPARDLGIVTIQGGTPTSLPTQIPATMEGIPRDAIEHGINATDSEDALRYFPSLLVRKRYAGDYNHAILSSRASGTGNSARSAVYADGILLSNFLGNGVGGLAFPPRWGLVTPEEIERVDVMYGPFSAAYPGNSVGAVVEYVTRMPTKFEAHVRAGYVVQPFSLYQRDATYRTWQSAATLGSRAGDWQWLLHAQRTDSHSQPLTFATRLVSTGTPGGSGVPVTGAVLERNNADAPWLVLGTGTQYDTVQDHVKGKVAYNFSPTLRATYTAALWQNDAAGNSQSYLRNAAGGIVTSGGVQVDGRSYAALTGGDFAVTRERLTHVMQGLTLRSNTRGAFDWAATASAYDYRRDDKRQNGAGNPLPGALGGGAGTLADGSGTGWRNFALQGTWRPSGAAHIVEVGVQHDRYRLSHVTSSLANWLNEAPGALVSNVQGRTTLTSLWVQDAWRLADRWKAVLGLRGERWNADDGRTTIANATPAIDTAWPRRGESHVSPKAALSWQAADDLVVKAAVGRAVRFPTVAELYGGTSTTNALFINDPDLRPERSWTGELSLEREFGNARARATLFAETTRDALFTQTTLDPVANRNVSRVQNVGRIATHGVELAFNGTDLVTKGLDLNGSVTYTQSFVRENAGFVAVPGDTLGRRQPNVPRWRAAFLATQRWTPQWSTSLGLRASGAQFRTLDNSDIHGFTYQGVSSFVVADLRARWQASKVWSMAVGVDNVNNAKYWNFHPYPQRSWVAEVKADL